MTIPVLGRHSPRLKELRHLETPAGRAEAGRFLMEGVRVVQEAIGAEFPLELLLVGEEAPAAVVQLALSAQRLGAEVYRVADEHLERLAPAKSSQGLLGVARLPVRTVADTLRGPLVLVLEGVQDPGNVGTLLRTARAAGASGAILIGGADAFNARAVRSSAGAVFRLPVARVSRRSEGEVLAALRASGHGIVAAEAHGGQDLFAASLPPRMALILGAEVEGVSDPLRSAAALRVTIPLAAGTESLNVAAAGALILFEHRRWRRA